MTETLNDRTSAREPGGLLLSQRKLRALQPELYCADGLEKLLGPVPDSQREWWKTHCREHLEHGEGGAAVVISTDPLQVAAYTGELDCVVLLAFPTRVGEELVLSAGLEPGARLLSVNTYTSLEAQPEPAPDLTPGPQGTGRWANVSSLIADFLSDDQERLSQRKEQISQAEWARCEELGKAWLRAQRPARDGRPVLAHLPALEQAAPPRRSLTTPQRRALGLVLALVALTCAGRVFVEVLPLLRQGAVYQLGVSSEVPSDSPSGPPPAKPRPIATPKAIPTPTPSTEGPILRSLRSSEDPNVRVGMARALGVADPSVERANALGLALVDDASAAVRREAARSLLRYGQGAKSTVANLEIAASDPDRVVRELVARILTELQIPRRNVQRRVPRRGLRPTPRFSPPRRPRRVR